MYTLFLPSKATAKLPAQTPLIQLPPITIRIVHCDLASCHYPPGDHQDPFLPAPIELLKLAIWSARVVDESCEVSHMALEDLVRSRARAANHHVYSLDAVGNQTGKFSNCGTAVKVLIELAIYGSQWR